MKPKKIIQTRRRWCFRCREIIIISHYMLYRIQEQEHELQFMHPKSSIIFNRLLNNRSQKTL